jgi:hypothetical protein
MLSIIYVLSHFTSSFKILLALLKSCKPLINNGNYFLSKRYWRYWRYYGVIELVSV